MARHAYPSLENLPEHLAKEIRNRVAPDRGNVWRMLMWTPETARSFIDFSEAVRHGSKLPPKLRELIILRVGELCGAAYEVHHHRRIGREVGMSEQEIEATKTGSRAAGLDDTQRLVLSMAEELVSDKKLSDATYKKALDAFGIRALADMILLVGFYITACLFLKTFEIDIEQPEQRG